MMDAIKVDIDGEAVNKMVVDAIMQSSIGVELNKVIGTLTNNYEVDRIVKDALRQEVAKVITGILRTEPYAGRIRKWALDRAANDLTDEFVKNVWDEAVGLKHR